MRNMVTIINPRYCPICKKDNCVETYDIFGNNITYLYNNNIDKLKNKAISHMYCNNCRRTFIPNWTLRKYPIAMDKNDYEITSFLDNFIKGATRVHVNRK